MSAENPESRGVLAGSWFWLIPATLFLLIANGRHTVPVAAWLSLLFLLRFVRAQPKRIGLPVAWVVLFLTWAFQLRGMAPLPTVFYFVLAATFGLVLLLPLWVDRLLAPRLSGLLKTLVLPCAWVAMEWSVATFTPYGSWGSLAYTQHENLVLLQLMSVTGLYGVSFLIAWFAAVGSWVWEQGWNGGTRRGALVFAAVCVVVLSGGGLRLALLAPDSPTVRIASLSRSDQDLFEGVEERLGSIMAGDVSEESVQRIRANGQAIVDDLFLRAEREIQAGARILFWGETNGFSFKEDEPALLERGEAFARNHQVYLGMSPAVFDPTREKPLENKIVLVDPQGRVAFEYHKAIPIPGGEAATQFRGDGLIKTVDSPHGRLGAAICFDMDFPGLLGQAGRLQTDILLVPSNDWREIDPWHSHMARFRAIEQGFNMVRHVSNGLSLACDYQGRVVASMDHFVTDHRSLVAYVPSRGVRTLYSRIGDVFAWICMLGLVVLVGMGSIRGRGFPQG